MLGIADALYQMRADDERAKPAAPTAPAAPTFADDDYITGKDLRAMIAAASGGGAAVDLAASANLGIIRQQYAQDFADYGPEIDALVAQVPPNLRNLDNLTRVVKMVRSDHVDEIAHKRAQQLVSTMEPTLRSNGAAAAMPPIVREHSLESEKIPAEWKERALKAGITEAVVADFCRANDMTVEAFYKQFDRPPTPIVAEHSTRKAGVSTSA